MLGTAIGIASFMSNMLEVCKQQPFTFSFMTLSLAKNCIQLRTAKERRFPELFISKLFSHVCSVLF
jgi:hypothetical protein